MPPDNKIWIAKHFDTFELDIDFKISTRVTGILGASGAGKSLLLKSISGLLTPDQGKIVLNNEILFDHTTGINRSPQWRKTGFVFQNYALFPHLTVRQNVGFGLNIPDKKVKKSRIDDLLQTFHLERFAESLPRHISGGQQQRCALARALATQPSILLLDEPFSALDDHLRHTMLNELNLVLKKFDIYTLIVTHNIDEAYRLCDELVILKQGRVEITGPKEAVFTNPTTLEAARLTGCKNTIPADKTAQQTLRVPSWQLEFVSDNMATTDTGYLAVRANHIRLKLDSDRTNLVDARIISALESPFRMTLYLKIISPQETAEDVDLQMEISKEKWQSVKAAGPSLTLCLPPEHLMFVRD